MGTWVDRYLLHFIYLERDKCSNEEAIFRNQELVPVDGDKSESGLVGGAPEGFEVVAVLAGRQRVAERAIAVS